MRIVWFLFPIAFAADADCLNLSPNVTDEECGNLSITVQFFDPNENCSQALFSEKFKSLDSAFAGVVGETFTAIRQKQKEEVWLQARRNATRMHQDEDDLATRVDKISTTTKTILKDITFDFGKTLSGNLDDIQRNLNLQDRLMKNATVKLSGAQDALQTLSSTMREFSQLHDLYITIRARSNRVHRCNAELQRVDENLLLRGTAKDDEQVFEECEDLVGKDLTQKLLETSSAYCRSPEETHRRRFLTSTREQYRKTKYLTMAECLEEADYPDFRAGRTYENEDTLGFQQNWFASIDKTIYAECEAFHDHLRVYIWRRSSKHSAETTLRLIELMNIIDQQASSIAVSTNTCASEARSIYRKFKANAELLAKGQACGQKMTERWSANVEKCLKANAWTKVWLPWYNIPHLFGDENNCVKTRNLILGGMITAMSSLVIFFVVIWCLRCACCSCRWLRCRKSHESRKRTNKPETKQTDGRPDQASNEGTKCTRTRTRPSKKDVLATVLENTRYHPSSDAASMSTNDHSSLVSDHSEFSRETNLYQPAVHPRTDYSSSSGYERNGRRSVASESSANSGRQPNESDLEAPALFYLPNLLPNNVISPPTLITLPHIRSSTDSAARIAVPFTPHLGFAPQGAVQPPFGALPPACRTSTRSRTVPSYLTPPNSPAPTSLTTSTPAPSGHVARSTTRHQTAFISRP